MTNPLTPEFPTPLHRAIALMGGQADAAAKLQCSPGLIWQWLNGRRPLAIDWAPKIEAASGVRADELLPGVDWTRDANGVIDGYRVPLVAA